MKQDETHFVSMRHHVAAVARDLLLINSDMNEEEGGGFHFGVNIPWSIM